MRTLIGHEYEVRVEDFDQGTIDPSRKDILIYVLGVLSAIATQIVSYYFGSSQGSAAKNSAIDKMLEKK